MRGRRPRSRRRSSFRFNRTVLVGVCDGGSGYRFLLVCFDSADDDTADADSANMTRAELRGGNLGGHSCVRADR